jgi:hypothetical protein
MRLKLREVKQMLDDEKQWCIDNPSPELPKSFQDGFIAGLGQAFYIIRKMETLIAQDAGVRMKGHEDENRIR